MLYGFRISFLLANFTVEKLKITHQKSKKMEKKVSATRIKNRIYKAISPLTSRLYKDEDWSGVATVLASIRMALSELSESLDLRVSVEDGGYRENNGAHWKEYCLSVVDESSDKKMLAGHLNAHGAGSVEDPFSRYDMTVVLY